MRACFVRKYHHQYGHIMARYIFVTGGVVSSLGKGIAGRLSGRSARGQGQ